MPNKLKIFNDPVYGFITIPFELCFDIIEHPYFQRLRRIKQLGLTSLVYPGALHTRFHHALGAMHLMGRAIETIRLKGVEITNQEAEAVTVAILLHDIGHGPFSHALEYTITQGVSHEEISLLLMKKLDEYFEGKLTLAISIFENKYHKKFLHQLVSSQLDMDRLDYLKRDSFFTGVSEGVISSDRIINMLTVVNDQLAVEAKGIYSVEKFILARRLMYWQVYYHKTTVAAEQLLIQTLLRAKKLMSQGIILHATDPLLFFLKNQIHIDQLRNDEKSLNMFTTLDDDDVFASIKMWQHHEDKILSKLSTWLINRNLFAIQLQSKPFTNELLEKKRQCVKAHYQLNNDDVSYFFIEGNFSNTAYHPLKDKISISLKDGSLLDVSEASEQLNMEALASHADKYFMAWPKELKCDE
jgi:HD superfamily phosphohydrolase